MRKIKSTLCFLTVLALAMTLVGYSFFDHSTENDNFIHKITQNT
jgi:hypothetical protein